MDEPLDLTTRKNKPVIGQYFSLSEQTEKYFPGADHEVVEPIDASSDNDDVTEIRYDKVGRSPGLINRSRGPTNRYPGSISRSPGSISRDTGSINRYYGSISRSPGSISRGSGSINRDTGSVKSYTMENGNSLSDPRHGADPVEAERHYNTEGPGNKFPDHQGPVDTTRSRRDLQIPRDLQTTNDNGLGERCADLEASFGRDASGDLFCEREGIRVRILDSHLWMTFNEIQTEMIINRGGRRMFPYLYISVAGLEPDGMYDILLDVLPADKRRFKFFNDAWVPVGVAEPQRGNPPYVHPDSSSPGSLWMARKISFARVKLTNSLESSAENVFLHSMHKYVIRITIRRRHHVTSQVENDVEFLLQETNFIAVTAYQNSKITHLKIINNPFAKAFRGHKPRYKRQRRSSSEKDRMSEDLSYSGPDGHDVSDEVSRRHPESDGIFPWTQQTRDISTSHQGNELNTTSQMITSETKQDSPATKMSMSPYLFNAYQAGLYASIMAYQARLTEFEKTLNK